MQLSPRKNKNKTKQALAVFLEIFRQNPNYSRNKKYKPIYDDQSHWILRKYKFLMPCSYQCAPSKFVVHFVLFKSIFSKVVNNCDFYRPNLFLSITIIAAYDVDACSLAISISIQRDRFTFQRMLIKLLLSNLI